MPIQNRGVKNRMAKEYNGYILDLFEGDVEVIQEVEAVLNNINHVQRVMTGSIAAYIMKQIEEVN